MDKDFEKRVKSKKKHKIAACFIVVAAIVVLVLGTRIEKADVHRGQETGDKNTIEISLEIRCDALSRDLTQLKKGEKAEYVPENGMILEKTVVEAAEGSTVYDVLYQTCKEKDIHMEASYTPGTETAYVEGIQYLYEFDAGQMSGWMYFINEEEPDHGCSDYVLEGGEDICWAYTCDRGKDL